MHSVCSQDSVPTRAMARAPRGPKTSPMAMGVAPPWQMVVACIYHPRAAVGQSMALDAPRVEQARAPHRDRN